MASAAVAELEEYAIGPELNRKVCETLEWLFAGIYKGRLTEDQFSIAIDTLFMAVAGLVDKDYAMMMTEAQSLCPPTQSVVRKLFHAPENDEIMVFRWVSGEARVVVSKRVGGIAVSGNVTEHDSPEIAAKFMRTVGEMMDRRGWIEI